MKLIQSLKMDLGSLHMERLNILPVLLEQADQEVHGQVHVSHEVILSHGHIANSHGETEHLLHLELDGGLQVGYLQLQVVAVCHEGRKLPSLVQSWPQKPRDLLDKSVGGNEGIVAFR